MLPWHSFVALGDSLTEGVGDPVRGGGLRGWADRLADSLHEVDPSLVYVNLARRGLRTEEVRRTQLDAAIAIEPHIASVLSGMNDLLDPQFDPNEYERELEATVAPLSETGALVLMATFPDITVFSPMPKRLTSGVRSRLEAASDKVREVASRHDTICLDSDSLPGPLEREIIGVDRLHPSPRGHVLLAQLFAKLLAERAGVDIPEPEPAGSPSRWLQARWLIGQFDPVEIGRHVWKFYLAPSKRRTGS